MKEELKNLVVIPARRRSKRLLGKNSKPFCGIPLITYTINYALMCCMPALVVVSTDDPKIKNIALELGIDVIDRPDELAGDKATTASAVKHALNNLSVKGLSFDIVTTLQVTTPLRPINLFRNCLSVMEEHNPDSVISVTRNRRKLGLIKNECFIPENYILGSRSQDIEPQFFENGLLYITRTDMILEHDDLFGRIILPYETEEQFPLVDIDDQSDFEYGEYLFTKYNTLFSYMYE